jgi:hypothetical protein
MTKLIHFDSGFIDNSNYSTNDDGTVTTGGLILVEGTHTDSKKKTHIFSRNRLFKIAENTNALFDSGATIPVLDNHNKSTKDTLGSVESGVRLEVITEDNLPNKRAKHLIGKLGLFVDEVVIKAADAVEKVSKNIVKTVSPGLDLATETIRELSLTPQPAIVGMSLYSENASYGNFGNNSTALTFDDLRNDNDQMEELEEQYELLTEQLWTITKNIQMADDDLLNGADPSELQMQAIQEFVDQFVELIGMNQDEQEEEEYQDPRMMQQGRGVNPNVGYSSDLPLAAFSMADMEAIYNSENAEFGYRKAVSGLLREIRQRGTTGKTAGEIASKFGSKMLNATKGKLAGVGRLGKRIGQTISGSSVAKNPKLSDRQRKVATNVITKSGGRMLTKSGKFTPSSNLQTKTKQVRTKNTFVVDSPSSL